MVLRYACCINRSRTEVLLRLSWPVSHSLTRWNIIIVILSYCFIIPIIIIIIIILSYCRRHHNNNTITIISSSSYSHHHYHNTIIIIIMLQRCYCPFSWATTVFQHSTSNFRNGQIITTTTTTTIIANPWCKTYIQQINFHDV